MIDRAAERLVHRDFGEESIHTTTGGRNTKGE